MRKKKEKRKMVRGMPRPLVERPSERTHAQAGTTVRSSSTASRSNKKTNKTRSSKVLAGAVEQGAEKRRGEQWRHLVAGNEKRHGNWGLDFNRRVERGLISHARRRQRLLAIVRHNEHRPRRVAIYPPLSLWGAVVYIHKKANMNSDANCTK